MSKEEVRDIAEMLLDAGALLTATAELAEPEAVVRDVYFVKADDLVKEAACAVDRLARSIEARK